MPPALNHKVLEIGSRTATNSSFAARVIERIGERERRLRVATMSPAERVEPTLNELLDELLPQPLFRIERLGDRLMTEVTIKNDVQNGRQGVC